MRRACLLAAVLLGLAGMASPAWSNALVSLDVHSSDSGAAVMFHAVGTSPGSVSPAVPASYPMGRTPRPVYEVDRPSLAFAGGAFCVSVARSYVTDPAVAATANAAAEGAWAVLLGQWGPCPGVALPGGAALPPSVVAASFWEAHGQDLLGRPAPRIPPGYALAGKPAYLETGGATAQSFTNGTPAGALSIAATGVFLVDWGDGTGLAGPYDTSGGPYPSGRITHVYDRVGSYTVTVYETWSATWSLAGQQGELRALRTEGDFPAFPVRQLESVRNR